MSVEIKNGASVSRMWGDDSGELLGAFQYASHAIAFAKLMAQDDTRPSTVYYVVTNHHDGEVRIVRSALP